MSKITISGLKSAASAYVTSAQQAGAWVASTNNVIGLLDKVAKITTIDGSFQDKLGFMDGEDLPLGKTIEEYFIDLTLPEAFDATGATPLANRDPSVESVTYSYTLGRKVIPTSVRYDNLERACNTAEEFGNMVAKIMERLTNSETMWKFGAKKQLLGNMIAKAQKASLVKTMDQPADDVSGEAFIKEIKERVEEASFPNEGNNLGNYLIGSAPELTLFIKKGCVPSLQVDTLAGAFQKDELAIPARIVVVDDFGADTVDVKAGDGVTPHVADNVDNSKVYAFLVDARGIKLHNTYRAIREQVNAQGDFVNYFLHSEYTGYISKSVYCRAYKHS